MANVLERNYCVSTLGDSNFVDLVSGITDDERWKKDRVRIRYNVFSSPCFGHEVQGGIKAGNLTSGDLNGVLSEKCTCESQMEPTTAKK